MTSDHRSAETAVLAVLDRFWSGWEALDAARILATLADGDALTFIGTDADEYWHSVDAVREPFRSMTAAFVSEQVRWSAGDPRVQVAGDVAWTSGRLRITVGLDDETTVEDDVRATFVLHRSGAAWRIIQAHISVAPSAPVAPY